jgi:23S rRNA (uracil747-C5)-methyltransferase
MMKIEDTFCNYYNQGICNSCDLIHLNYSEQIRKKEEILKNSLKEILISPLLPTEPSELTHFRNKAKLVVTGTKERPVIGLLGENNPDEGRELLNCSLHTQPINRLLQELPAFITTAAIEPYNISSRKGELKGIIVFYSEGTNQTYLRFILRSKESIDRIRKHAAIINHVNCLSVNIQPIPHAILEGEEEIFITQVESIHHKLDTVTTLLGPRAFVQTNQQVAEKLYQTAALWVEENRVENFMELFCGQGAFSFFCAPFIREGLGIEINPDAVKKANQSAKDSKLFHLRFKTADAAKIEDEILQFDPDLILVNPPRRGLASTIHLLLKQKPRTIIYSSCNHQTLASDLKILKESYEIKRIKIFDMFAHTSHFEILVELSRLTK